ncbi:hypothetical protein D3C80_1657600 [compost metagenome]
MRRRQKGVLAGQAADLAGQVRIECQVLAPQLLMAQLGDAIEAMATLIVQRRTQRRLAGGGAQEQGFGSR